MKKLFLLLPVFLFWVCPPTGYAQSSDYSYFPSKGRSIHIGTSLFHTLISGNFEKYKHSPNGKHHWGGGYGFSIGGGYFGAGFGAHLIGNYWSGRGKNHFQASLGVAPTFFTGTQYESAAFFPVPIVLVGYRRQAPEANRFFYIHVGSVGVGVGFGKAIDN